MIIILLLLLLLLNFLNFQTHSLLHGIMWQLYTEYNRNIKSENSIEGGSNNLEEKISYIYNKGVLLCENPDINSIIELIMILKESVKKISDATKLNFDHFVHSWIETSIKTVLRGNITISARSILVVGALLGEDNIQSARNMQIIQGYFTLLKSSLASYLTDIIYLHQTIRSLLFILPYIEKEYLFILFWQSILILHIIDIKSLPIVCELISKLLETLSR